MSQERLRITHHDLTIFGDAEAWEVWFEPRGGELDGLCVGSGETRNGAVQNAVLALEEAIGKLQELTTD